MGTKIDWWAVEGGYNYNRKGSECSRFHGQIILAIILESDPDHNYVFTVATVLR